MILVTGGTGFIGRHLVSQLCEAGAQVSVLTRNPEVARGSLPEGVRLWTGDLLDPISLTRAVSRAHTVIHLAAELQRLGMPVEVLKRTNVVGTRNIVEVALRADVQRLVHLSTAAVYGNGSSLEPRSEATPPAPSSDYARSKFGAEREIQHLLMDSDIAWAVLRTPEVHGLGRLASEQFFRTALRRQVWFHGPAVVLVQPTFVDDVIKAIRLCLLPENRPKTIFNIAGNRIITFPEWISLIARRSNRRPFHVQAPQFTHRGPQAVRAGLKALGLPSPEGLDRFATPVINRSLDITRARTELGFKPMAVEQGVDHMVAQL